MEKETLAGVAIGILCIKGSFTECKGDPRVCVRHSSRESLDIVREVLGGVVYGPYKNQNKIEYYMYGTKGKALLGKIEFLSMNLSGICPRFVVWRDKFAKHFQFVLVPF